MACSLNRCRLTKSSYRGEVIEQDNDDEDNTSDGNNSLQTFIFSATMSKDLQRNVKKRSRPRMTKKKAPASTLGESSHQFVHQHETDYVVRRASPSTGLPGPRS